MDNAFVLIKKSLSLREYIEREFDSEITKVGEDNKYRVNPCPICSHHDCFTIYEANQRIGGKVWTEVSPDGYLCEGGVNGFLDKIPRTLELCKEVGVCPHPADHSAQQRSVAGRGGRQ